MHDERLHTLRQVMRDNGLSAWIAFDADSHGSEYVADRFRARSWLSGFRGSAGTLAVTRNAAGLWTDSRYFLEAEHALSESEIALFRSGLPDTQDYPDWLIERLARFSAAGQTGSGAREGPGAREDLRQRDGESFPHGVSVGVDAGCTSLAELRRLEEKLSPHGITVTPCNDLLDAVWSARPGLPKSAVFGQPIEFAGESRSSKLARVRGHMNKRGATSLLISSLDDIAWLTNLRGSDVAYNPVFLSFVLVTRGEALLFIDRRKVGEQIAGELSRDGIRLVDYVEAFHGLSSHLPEGAVLLSPDKTAVTIYRALPHSNRVIEERDITTDFKARKNDTELSGIRTAMRRDGRAMVRFLRMLEDRAPTGSLSELSAANILQQFRSEEDYFMGASFPTISGFRGHGAIVHYSVSEESDVPLGDGMYLVDSGGHYRDGTTDITRTVCFGMPPPGAIEDFTYVLKAHIALATIRFPEGTTGTQLDAVARESMWRSARDYGHGTGHGVGCFLNVHEGPQRLASRLSSIALRTGMVNSNEPGLYRKDEYGIRIENLTNVVEDERGPFGRFLAFETLTLCPIDTRLVDTSLLSERELSWLNEYHLRVRDELSPLLEGEDRRWLEQRTERVGHAR